MQINTHQKELGKGHQGHIKIRSCDFDPKKFSQIYTHQKKKKLGQGHQGHVKVRSCDLDLKKNFICKLIHT